MWSEAQKLTFGQVSPTTITFINTKGLKPRSIAVSEFVLELLPVQLNKNKKMFNDEYANFSKALKIADITLPKGQLTHVLRHSFASHFIMSGGDIVVLQKTLGHASIETTMRYIHLAPDHMRQVLTKSPINILRPLHKLK